MTEDVLPHEVSQAFDLQNASHLRPHLVGMFGTLQTALNRRPVLPLVEPALG